MKEKLLELKEKALQELKNSIDLNEVENIRIKFLGKKNELANILKEIGKLPDSEKKEVGMIANKVRNEIEERIVSVRERIKQVELEQRLKDEDIDVTIPVKTGFIGKMHPISLVMRDINLTAPLANLVAPQLLPT